LDHEYQDDPVFSFPAAINVTPVGNENRRYSRLAWCYGDLCIANTLIHCGKALHRADWYDKGIGVALKTTYRGLEGSGCIDAPFCHGTVGLVHQYHRLFQLTKHKAFKDVRNKWIDITQEHFYKEGEEAGGYYFASYHEKKDEFESLPQYGLLEGSAGIALVYLSIVYDLKPDWDIIFLTNV
jgi:lantibiotic modifying enzyme